MTIMELIALLVAVSPKFEACEDVECVITLLLGEDRPSQVTCLVESVLKWYGPLEVSALR